MAIWEEINTILDRVISGEPTEADIVSLRQLLSAFNERDVVQLSKNIANIAGQGNDIQIGDRDYQDADAESIKKVLLKQFSIPECQLI